MQSEIHRLLDALPGLVALQRWQTIVATCKAGELEARMRRFDGTYRWIHFHMSPVMDATGRIVEWCGIMTDIERRKHLEAEQRAQSEEGSAASADPLAVAPTVTATPETGSRRCSSSAS